MSPTCKTKPGTADATTPTAGRRVVCVLGMHRSGTSLLTRLLNISGVYLGPPEHMMRWLSGNPRGHWEHEGILEINKEILARLGGSWQDIPVFPQGWEQAPALADLRRKARDIIDEDFASADLWGWKDPRTSLTLPFWQNIVSDMHYLLCIRNPIDVSRSLSARPKESVDARRASHLWLRYVHAALRHSAGHKRQVVFYEDLMDDSHSELNRINDFLGIPPLDDSDVEVQLQGFIEGALWHHRASVADVLDDGELSFAVKATYLGLRLAASSSSPLDGADALELVGTVSEYALDAGDLSAAAIEDGRRDAAAAAQEASEAWQLLREHRVRLAKLISSPKATAAPPERSAYRSLLDGIRSQVKDVVPAGARVLVVSKGDDALLDLVGVEARHFPQDDSGEYAGFHPASSEEAVEQLNNLRSQGASFLLFPKPYAWWLDHYAGLADYLAQHAVLRDDGQSCLVYELVGPAESSG